MRAPSSKQEEGTVLLATAERQNGLDGLDGPMRVPVLSRAGMMHVLSLIA
jgi:hypothetical protein